MVTKLWLWWHRRHGEPFVEYGNNGWSWYACTAPCNKWKVKDIGGRVHF